MASATAPTPRAAEEPPTKCWNRLCGASRVDERYAECYTPDAIAKAEDQQGLCKPKRAVDDDGVIPEIRENAPETFALVECDHGCGERTKDEDEGEERDAKTREAVAEKCCVALALERWRCEIAGEQKEETHEVGLLRGAEERQEQAGGRARGMEFVIEPAACRAIGDCSVMQDDERGHDTAQAIDVEVTLRSSVRGSDGRISRLYGS